MVVLNGLVCSIYFKRCSGGFNPETMAQRLWGDIYFDEVNTAQHVLRSVLSSTSVLRALLLPTKSNHRPWQGTRKFSRKAADSQAPRSFVQFVLEPFYKMIAQSVGEHPRDVETMFEKIGVKLKPQVKTDNDNDNQDILTCNHDRGSSSSCCRCGRGSSSGGSGDSGWHRCTTGTRSRS